MNDVESARDLARHLRLTEMLAPLGWAIHGRWHLSGTIEVLKLADSGATTEAIDELVTDLWNINNFALLKHTGAPLRTYGQIHPNFQRIGFARADLIDQAFACHQAGHYMASMLLTYAQIDGLTRDITGESFFSTSKNDPYLSDDTLAGIADNLPTVRLLFNESVNESGFFEKLSRHAVAHGRDLASGTQTNSTKALVLLGALVEYLRPRAGRVANREQRAHESNVRGVSGTDTEGRLVDDRHLHSLSMFRQKADMIVSKTFVLLGGPWTSWQDSIVEEIQAPYLHRNRFTWGGASEKDAWWFYQVPAGQHLGRAVRRNGDGFPVQLEHWLWDRPEAPDGPPWEADGWVHDDGSDPPPNWWIADVTDRNSH